ncbi:hypothetical protein [Micromonospora sp. NPDC051006]|uniref:hypothetical protein n=1 Tax=Micromonospora sp. NPDC051006 TaxID=3364283 RepID=UPI0037A2457F
MTHAADHRLVDAAQAGDMWLSHHGATDASDAGLVMQRPAGDLAAGGMRHEEAVQSPGDG